MTSIVRLLMKRYSGFNIRHLLICIVLVTTMTVSVKIDPARAFVLAQDELGGSSTELGLDIRSFNFVFTGPLLKPPYTLIDEDPASLDLTDMRLYFSIEQPWLKVVVHNQLTDQMMSGALAGPFNIGQGPVPLRWLPLNWTLVNKNTFIMEDAFDWAYASIIHGPVTITAGRQPVTFGRGKIWSPMDVIAPFSLTDVDTEYKSGVDAVRMDVTPAENTNLSFVATAGKWDNVLSARGSSFAVRATQGWSTAGSGGITGGEIGFLGGLVRSDKVVGVDGLVNAGKADMYGEATLTLPDDESLTPRPPQTRLVVVKGVAGVTFKPVGKLTVSPEVLFNGFGATGASDYLRVATSGRMTAGEIYTMGRIYLAETAVWEPYPLLDFSLAALVNLQDPSALFVPALKYNVANSVDISVGAYLPAGRLPSISQNSTMLPVLAPHSEFGLYPDFFFLELRMYL
jgi:hypothetical protein